MIKIAFYGKGGIGKSTTVSNIAAALAQKGLTVLQIGCDPKADSTRLLCSDPLIRPGFRDKTRPDADSPDREAGEEAVSSMLAVLRSGSGHTVMDHIRSRQPFAAEDVIRPGFAGVLCAEAGGPLPGQGCAGRAVITALEKLEELGAYEKYQPDVVLFDVLGDVVCGGFAMPMRAGYADLVYILTSGETMSLYAAANIGLALDHFKDRGYARNGGLILNRRNVPCEEERTEALARELGTQVVGSLSRSDTVLLAEEKGMCVLQAFPESDMAAQYRDLADRISEQIQDRISKQI